MNLECYAPRSALIHTIPKINLKRIRDPNAKASTMRYLGETHKEIFRALGQAMIPSRLLPEKTRKPQLSQTKRGRSDVSTITRLGEGDNVPTGRLPVSMERVYMRGRTRATRSRSVPCSPVPTAVLLCTHFSLK